MIHFINLNQLTNPIYKRLYTFVIVYLREHIYLLFSIKYHPFPFLLFRIIQNANN